MLRNVQEVLGNKEYKVGAFYQNKGSMPAAANRLQVSRLMVAPLR